MSELKIERITRTAKIKVHGSSYSPCCCTHCSGQHSWLNIHHLDGYQVWPRVFVLGLLIALDGVDRIPASAPHLEDEVGDSNEVQEEKPRQDGKFNFHVQQGVDGMLLA